MIGKACPLFVPLVEEGWYHDPVTEEVARKISEGAAGAGDRYTDPRMYALSSFKIYHRKIMGEEVCLVNPAYETALELKKAALQTGSCQQ